MRRFSLSVAGKTAFVHTAPIAMGFLFLGVAYGVYTRSLGFHWLYPLLTAMLIYAGSVEFVIASLLLLPFAPLSAFLVALTVSARQAFYGVSVLEKYRHLGKKRFFLIATLVDESFPLHYRAHALTGVDQGAYMLWVSAFLYAYWTLGVGVGAWAGKALPFDLAGVEFAMTALFLVIFAEQWKSERDHFGSLLGLGATALALVAFGKEHFLLPALLGILATLTWQYRRKERAK